MGKALVVITVLVTVRVVFRLLAAGWARPWAARYLEATARREQEPSDQQHDRVRIVTRDRVQWMNMLHEAFDRDIAEGISLLQLQSVLGLTAAMQIGEKMVLENDPFGSNLPSDPFARPPRWVVSHREQSPGPKSTVSYAHTPEAAKAEAALLLGVPADSLTVAPYMDGGGAWINPQA